MRLKSALRAALPVLVTSGMIGVGKVLQIGLLAFMARRMDLAAFGLLGIAINLSQIGAYLYAMGLPSGATRFVAALRAQNEVGLLKGFLRFCGSLSSIGVMLCVATGAMLVWTGTYSAEFGIYLVALTAVSAVGVSRAGLSLGFGDLFGSLAPREIIAPLLSILALWMITTSDSTALSWIYLLGFLFAEVLGAVFFANKVPAEVRNTAPRSRNLEWLKVLAPLHLIALLTMAMQRLDVVFVGALLDLESAALYTAAQRVAQTLSILSRVSSFVVSPRIAHTFHGGVRSDLTRIVWTAVAFGALVAVPVCLIVVLFAPFILGLFGEKFQTAAPVLVFLALGQTFSAVLGPTAQAMTMTDAERPQLLLLLLCTVAAVVGYWFITPVFGAVGVATWSCAIMSCYTLGTLVFSLRILRGRS